MWPLQIDLGAETGLINSNRAFQRPDAFNDRQFQRTLREKASFVDLDVRVFASDWYRF